MVCLRRHSAQGKCTRPYLHDSSVGINLKDRGEQKKIEGKIEAKVKEIVNKLKSTHEKFEDPDFGPNEKDEFGALSFYGSSLPAPAGSKYPAPETLRWERPIYDDSKFSYGAVANEDEPEEEAEEVENDYDDEFGFSGGDDQDSVCNHCSRRLGIALVHGLRVAVSFRRSGADMANSFWTEHRQEMSFR